MQDDRKPSHQDDRGAPWRDDDDLPSFNYRADKDDPTDIWGDPVERQEASRETPDDTSESRDISWENDDISAEYPGDEYSSGDDDQAPDDFPPRGSVPVEAESEPGEDRWPLALLAVAAVALILLAAGGYGVMQQRSAMQAEITELQARLAETASPEEVVAVRRALEDMRTENAEMRSLITSLQEENQRLADTLAGLEKQLEAQQEATEKARSVATSTPARSQQPPAPAASQTQAGGAWFVNFGAYREQRLANEWAERLRSSGNRVIVTPVESGGRSLHRVRITGFSSESSARELARKLEREFSLDPLWVGKQ